MAFHQTRLLNMSYNLVIRINSRWVAAAEIRAKSESFKDFASSIKKYSSFTKEWRYADEYNQKHNQILMNFDTGSDR